MSYPPNILKKQIYTYTINLDITKNKFTINKLSKRLGSPTMGGYPALKQHPFFADVDWDRVLEEDISPHLREILITDSSTEEGSNGDEIDEYLDELQLLEV